MGASRDGALPVVPTRRLGITGTTDQRLWSERLQVETRSRYRDHRRPDPGRFPVTELHLHARPDFRRSWREVFARGVLAASPRGVTPRQPWLPPLTCCYAPGATVGMRSSWHPVVGKLDRPCRSQGLSWSSSHRPSSRRVAGLLTAGRGDGIASRVWAWTCCVPAAWHRDTLCHLDNWHNWHSGQRQHGTAITLADTGVSRRLDRR